MSTVDVDPSTLFGGTWERVKDKFLLTAGDNYAAGSTGGSTSHTHTNPSTGSTAITVEQMPSHNHGGISTQWVYYPQSGPTCGGIGGSNFIVNQDASWSTWSTGSGQGHTHTMGNTGSSSNMPPYLTVYCWRRTA